DGIRDLTVTGVQTCALPIYYLRQLGVHTNTLRRELSNRVELRAKRRAEASALMITFSSARILRGLASRRSGRMRFWFSCRPRRRSEERRVGRECRERGEWA